MHICPIPNCKGPKKVSIDNLKSCENPYWDSNGTPLCPTLDFQPAPKWEYYRVCSHCVAHNPHQIIDEVSANKPIEAPDNEASKPHVSLSTNEKRPSTNARHEPAEMVQHAPRLRPQSDLLMTLLGKGQEYIRPLKFFYPPKKGDGTQKRYAEICNEFKDHLNVLDYEYKTK
jgi:hypothetical protein